MKRAVHAWRRPWVFAVFVVILLLAMASGLPRWLVETVDRHWLGEAVKDTVGRYLWREDWHDVQPLSMPLDYRWLAAGGKPVQVAHALGAPGAADQNTLSAAQASLLRGWRLLEVDIWLDGAGRLRCHHGPDELPPFDDRSCTLDRLLRLTLAHGAYVVLDIKTDFERTADAVLTTTDPTALRSIVFQLYRPQHLALFANWSQHHALPGPIVTAYLAHRSLNHLAEALASSTVQVMTVPVARLPALRGAHKTVLVHPVGDCAVWRSVIGSGHADGGYAPSWLDCTHHTPPP